MCISIVDGYSIEEFKEWLQTMILLKTKLLDNVESLSEDNLDQVAGGIGFSKSKIALALIGSMLPITGITSGFAHGGHIPPSSSDTSVAQQTLDTDTLNEIAETAERCLQADYELSTIDDLNNLRELSKNGETFEGKHIVLKNDINITSNGNSDGGAIDFESIFVKDGVGFKGTFDGNGNCLNCNVKNGEILGNICKEGVVKNLNISGYFNGDIDGLLFFENNGILENLKINLIAKDTCVGLAGIWL